MGGESGYCCFIFVGRGTKWFKNKRVSIILGRLGESVDACTRLYGMNAPGEGVKTGLQLGDCAV